MAGRPNDPCNRPRRVLVTGGASGIGEAAARSFAETGHEVTVFDRDVTGNGCHERITPIQGDVCQQSAIEGFGHLELGQHFEVLVNCAGVSDVNWFADSTESARRREIAVNLEGLMNVTHAVLPTMLEGGWGRVVNLASDAGRIGASREVVYSATKGAVIAFTAALGREVARKGVTVNCVSPGPINTPMLAGYPEWQLAALQRMIPMRRLGEPRDVAAMIAFFASDRAAYITGQCISVNGGLVTP